RDHRPVRRQGQGRSAVEVDGACEHNALGDGVPSEAQRQVYLLPAVETQGRAMRGGLERDVIKATTDLADKLQVLWERNHKGPGAAAGWPDYDFYFPGAHVWIV